MTQVTNQFSNSPKQASKSKASIDNYLDVHLFKALGDPIRLKLLSCLARCARPCSVTEIAECCDVDFSVVTRHLALLARANVLQGTKQGRTMFYEVRYQDLISRFKSLAEELRDFHRGAVANKKCCKGC